MNKQDSQKQYNQKRRFLMQYFVPENIVKGKVDYTQWEDYTLDVYHYIISKKSWKFTEGVVRRISDNKQLAKIRRNYSSFWHRFLTHSNGNDYLLCGEDYQGYTIINLTTDKKHKYFPIEGHDGKGFCWTNAYPSPNSKILAVHGCYWAYTYEVVFYDFSKPDILPYKEIDRDDCGWDAKGWLDDDVFIKLEENMKRVSDGKLYHELTIDEQLELDDAFMKDQNVIKWIDDREIFYKVNK